MTMLIQKFHRMIQSRLLWLGFLVIVVFSFVVWGTYWPSGSNGSGAQNGSAGTLEDKPVPIEEYNHHYNAEYLNVTLRTMRPPPQTPEMNALLHKAAWHRLAAVRYARNLGLTASDEEVVSAIHSDPMFAQEKQFSQAYYSAFVQQFLGQLRVSETQFEEHVREEIMRQKLHFLVSQAALIPPHELQRRFHMLSDKFVIEYATFTSKLVEDEVKVSDEQAQAYFQAHAENFTVPEKVRASYVEFDVADYLPDVEVTEEQAQEYYDEHLEEFRIPEEDEADTNLIEVTTADESVEEEAPPAEEEKPAKAKKPRKKKSAKAEAAEASKAKAEAKAAPTNTIVVETTEAVTNAPDTNAVPAETAVDESTPPETDLTSTNQLARPFADVKEELLAKLRKDAARDKAAEVATDFVVDVAPDRYGKAMTFEEAAEKFKRKIAKLEPILEMEPVTNIDAQLDFNRAAFAMENTPVGHFSDPVLGEDHVYVLKLDENIPSRVPEFDEVKEEVRKLAREEEVRNALMDKITEIHGALDKSLQAGDSFEQALESYEVVPERTEEFSAMTGLTNSLYSDVILRGILARNTGELSDPLPAGEDIIFAYVTSRKEGDPAQFSSMKNQINQTLAQRQGMVLNQEWEEYLLKQWNFTDNLAKRAAAADEDADEDEGVDEEEDTGAVTNDAG